MECDNDNKKAENPMGAAIQKKFLEERKVFLWGEINDEYDEDERKIDLFGIKRARETNLILYQYPRRFYYCWHGDL